MDTDADKVNNFFKRYFSCIRDNRIIKDPEVIAKLIPHPLIVITF